MNRFRRRGGAEALQEQEDDGGCRASAKDTHASEHDRGANEVLAAERPVAPDELAHGDVRDHPAGEDSATDDGSGTFRVVVAQASEEEPWPSPQRLRQGVRAKGWFFLGQVPLGYELWRQLNGFPPLPKVDKGDKPMLPSQKKPKTPGALKQ